jgi:multiple sugar transport system ATP-binding protein
MARVTLSNVVKMFGDVTVIPDLNLEIDDKEFVVLVGPSGCGKTTTLRMIAGLESASGGEIRIGERDVTWLRPGLRNCSMVFQNYALYPHMTVRRNIGYGMKVRGVEPAERDRRIAEAARILGLEPYLERRPRALSGGQRQRVAIGRAIVRDPDVFLFDEPLSNLDAKLRIEMRTEIKNLHQRLQNTVVYVTHDQVEAMTLADRVVVMNQGIIEQMADPITLYEKPANTFVAAFIGAPSMDFLPATVVEKGGGGLVLRLDGGTELPVPEDLAPRWRDRVDTAVTFGIRPEHMAGGAVGPAVVTMDLTTIEPLGPHTLFIGSVGAERFTALVDAHHPGQPDTRAEITLDMTKMHLFDRETGAALR